jgi:hypothetical protein
MLMSHIISNDQNIVQKYATSNAKEHKTLKIHNKFGINAMKRKNRHLVATRDQGLGATINIIVHDYEKHCT